MKFKSRTEAFSYAIYILSKIRDSDSNASVAVDECLEHIKKSMENHEQNPAVVVEFLKKLTENAKLSEEDIKTLDELQENILPTIH